VRLHAAQPPSLNPRRNSRVRARRPGRELAASDYSRETTLSAIARILKDEGPAVSFMGGGVRVRGWPGGGEGDRIQCGD